MNSWYTIRARAEGAELSIHDEIGAYGVSARQVIAELGALAPGTALELRINSPGGSVFDAVAIYNALKRHDGQVTVTIDGIAASAASYIAMAGDEIVMPENTFLMIHDPSGLVMGTATDMRVMAETLDKIAGSLIRGYAAKSGQPDADIAALMAAETWFDAKDALDLGFADRIAEPVRIAARFDIAGFRNAPPALAEVAADGRDAAAAEADDGAIIAGQASGEGLAAGEASLETAPGSDLAAAVSDAGESPSTVPDPASDPGAETLGAVETFEADTGPPTESDPPHDVGSTVAAANGADFAASIRAAAMAHARAVVDLCRLAGQPQMAGRFLEKEASLEAVRTALIEVRARSEPDISAAHPQPGRLSGARPWGEIVARTFKLKG